jgi:hypothetical protein
VNQLAQSRSLRVYVRTPIRHIEARLVTASFREILVTETEESRKMSLFKRSVLKVGGPYSAILRVILRRDYF